MMIYGCLLEAILLEVVGRFEQPDSKLFGRIDLTTIDSHRPIRNAHDERANNDTPHIEAICHLFGGGKYLSSEFDYADAESTTLALMHAPTEEKAGELPESIKTQTTWHHWITRKMIVKKPLVRDDIEFSINNAVAVRAAGAINVGYPVDHEHIINGQFGNIIAKEQTASAFEDFFIII